MSGSKIKIAFIGTHGVGKTTLCFDLASRLKRLDLGVDIVKEVARGCPLPINEATTLEAQAWILHAQIAQEIVASAQNQAVICDRSVLDNYAYLVHRVGRMREYDALVRAWVGSYTGLFKVPVIQPPSYDGTRAVSRGFQVAIDEQIDKLIDVFGVKVHHLDRENRDGWLEEVMAQSKIETEVPQLDMFPAQP